MNGARKANEKAGNPTGTYFLGLVPANSSVRGIKLKKWSLALKADAKPCSWPPFGTANQQGPSSRVSGHRPGIGPAAGVSQQAAEFSIMEYWLWSSVAIPPQPVADEA